MCQRSAYAIVTENVSNIQIWVFARVLSIHNLAQSGFSLLLVAIPSTLHRRPFLSQFRFSRRSIQYIPSIKCDVFACLSYHLIRNVQSHFECRHPRTHIRTIHMLYICLHKTHSNHLHPKFEATIEYIIAIITKKWFGFSQNPFEFHVLNFANAYWSGTQFALVPANIRSFRMLSHKWDICLLEAVARSF